MATKKKSLINSRAAAQKAILATHNTPLAATPSVSSVDPQLKASGPQLGARAKSPGVNLRAKAVMSHTNLKAKHVGTAMKAAMATRFKKGI